MCNEIDLILQIMITFACAFMISMGFCGGYFKAKYKERICTETVSGIVLEKNGFSKIGESVFEDWGFSQKVYSDKWILKKSRTN